MPTSLDTILQVFHRESIDIDDFICDLFASPDPIHHAQVAQMAPNISEILDKFITHSMTRTLVLEWCCRQVTHEIQHEFISLAKQSSGLHFNARHVQASQVQDFTMEALGVQFRSSAPLFWRILATVMDSSTDMARKRRASDRLGPSAKKTRRPEATEDFETTLADEDLDYWRALGFSGGEESPNDLSAEITPLQEGQAMDTEEATSHTQQRAADARWALTQVRAITCISMLVQTVNRRANFLQAVNGFFLHSCGTPEIVITMLAHAGLSISTTAIHEGIKSLAQESKSHIRALGQTMLVAWSFDNIGWHQKPTDTTVENQGIHIEATNCMFVPLEHGVQLADLKYAEFLWARNPLNPAPTAEVFHLTVDHLVRLAVIYEGEMAPYPDGSGRLLDRRSRYYIWHVLRLLTQACAPFAHYARYLEECETIFQVPVKKTKAIAGRAMLLNEGTYDGMAAVFENLEAQAGVGHRDEPTFNTSSQVDMADFCIFAPQDLGSIEKRRGLQMSRSIEANSRRRIQNWEDMPGLLHVAMAITDALERVYLHPVTARNMEDSVYTHVGCLRPNQAGYFVSGKGPGHRRMHLFIHSDAEVCIQDCLLEHVQALDPKYTDLTSFAATNPSWRTLVGLAERIVMENVAGKEFANTRNQPNQDRDMVYENAQVKLRDFLLYIEFYHAVTHGDVGRVEATLVDWCMTFKAVGKHKYAVGMLEVLAKLNFLYPEKLSRAFRLNWLLNPRGQQDTFRAIDWSMELNNLYTKIIFAGTGPNRTVHHILEQSSLIDFFRACHSIIKDNYFMGTRTAHHTLPNMERTFARLSQEFRRVRPHLLHPGRVCSYSYADSVLQGVDKFIEGEEFLRKVWHEEEEDNEPQVSWEDIVE